MSEVAPDGGAGAPLRTRVARLGEGQLSGYVFDPAAPERRFVVELLLDGFPAAVARADLYDAELAREGSGDGCHGFVFAIAPSALASARRAEIRVANSGESVGAPVSLRAPPSRDDAPGAVVWQGGLHFSGWLAGDPARARGVRALVDGETAAEALATRWTHIGEGAAARGVRRFDLHLQDLYADGRAHRVAIVDEEGAELPGSPCVFVAFPDGLARFLDGRVELESERPRAALYDRLAPQSLPFSAFEDWRRAYPPAPPQEGTPKKIAVALIGTDGIEASVAGLEAQQGCDWVAGALEGERGPGGFDPALLLRFLDDEAADCGLVVFAPSGAVLQPQALALLGEALDAFPSAAIAYADFTLAGADGSEWPVALPAFDYEFMLEQGCGALFFAARTDHARAAAAAGADSLFRLFLFGQEARAGRDAARAPVHRPGFLARLPGLDLVALSHRLAGAVEAHLAARGVAARVARGRGALLPSARVARAIPQGAVSIVVPVREGVGLLQACCESLARTVDLARHELVVVGPDAANPETAAGLDRLARAGARIVRFGGPWNPARMINAGAAAARGDFILLFGAEIEALEPGWLDEMLSRIVEPDVGAVGAALLWPSGVVRHGGYVLGPEFSVAPAFDDCMDGDPGYGDRLRAAHEASAVASSCLLTRRALFAKAGGFDILRYPLHFGDVDYCLRLRAEGWRVVMTPHARLLARDWLTPGAAAGQRELRALRAAWGEALLADPAYHPLLSLDRTPFSGLAWPPRLAAPRQPVLAPPRPLPPGF